MNQLGGVCGKGEEKSSAPCIRLLRRIRFLFRPSAHAYPGSIEMTFFPNLCLFPLKNSWGYDLRS